MNNILSQIAVYFFLISSVLFAQQDTIRVACVGNSITEGNAMSTKLLDAYPIALGRYLGPGYNVKNCGVSGRTMLKKGDFPIWNESLFSEALKFNPNIVTIMLGTNDTKSYNWIYKSDFIHDYLAMIDTFRTGPGNPQIYICLPLPSFSDAYDIRDSVIVADIIPMVRKIADSAHVKLIDMNTPFLDKSSLMPDGIHPLIEGSDLIARIIYKELTGKTIDLLKENNASLNKQAYQGNTVMPQLTDGDPLTIAPFWRTIINLANEVQIDAAQIDLTGLSGSQQSISLEVSKDSISWTTVIDTTFIDSLLLPEGNISKFIAAFKPVSTKFIRLENKGIIPDSSSIFINEIKVFESRKVHAPVIGWKLVSQSSQSSRVRVFIQKISNAGEYLRIFRQSKDSAAYTIYSNYGASQPLNFMMVLPFGILNRFYTSVFNSGDEIFSDTLTIISTKPTDINDLGNFYPSGYTLMQNFPNPFNPSTSIKYSLGKNSRVNLSVYNLLGEKIITLISKEQQPGSYSVSWDAGSFAGGIYFYRLFTNTGFVQTRKLILLK